MTRLLSEAAARGIAPDYARKLLAAYEGQTKDDADASIRRATKLRPSPPAPRPS